jgi:hypothetical protein
MNAQVPPDVIYNFNTGTYYACPVPPQVGTANVVGISFGGQDVTGKTTKVVVGQQIALAANGVPSVSSQSWNIASVSNVGGYTVASGGASASIQATTTTQRSVTYYYTAAGSSTVTYTATLSSGGTVSATTTFTVQAPTYNISPSVSTVNVNQDHGPFMQLGRDSVAKGPPGVKFAATVTPPSGFSGALQWVQIVSSVSQTSTPNGGTCTGSGLDEEYPYSSNATMTDSPAVALESQYTTESISMSLTTYLQWQPPTPSIPVSIAQVIWSWSGTATQTNSVWAVTSSSPPQPAVAAAQTALPTWGQLAACH